MSFGEDPPEGKGFSFSHSAAALIQESWHPGTRVQYDSLLRGWHGFCSQRQIHTLSPTIFDVIAYLTFSAHSYQSASTSKATTTGVPLEKILRWDNGPPPLLFILTTERTLWLLST